MLREAERLIDDDEPQVRGAAIWALQRLAPDRVSKMAAREACTRSDHPDVRDEWTAAMSEARAMTKHFDFPRPHLIFRRFTVHGAMIAVISRGSLELGAAGAVALGALAIGAIAIGAIGDQSRLAVRRARIDRLSVGTLEVGRLVIHEREEPDDEVR